MAVGSGEGVIRMEVGDVRMRDVDEENGGSVHDGGTKERTFSMDVIDAVDALHRDEDVEGGGGGEFAVLHAYPRARDEADVQITQKSSKSSKKKKQ